LRSRVTSAAGLQRQRRLHHLWLQRLVGGATVGEILAENLGHLEPVEHRVVRAVVVEEQMHLFSLLTEPIDIGNPLHQLFSVVEVVETVTGALALDVPGASVATVVADHRQTGVGHLDQARE
jgi:hypothetical protein